MKSGRWLGFSSAFAWFFFPMVPALLGTIYHRNINWSLFQERGPDPRDWSWQRWLLLTGPLVGYGFLAGATLNLPDDSGRRGIRSGFSKRSVWVAVGPWAGFLAWAGILLGMKFVDWAYPASRDWSMPRLPDRWWTPWLGWFLYLTLLFGPLAYGWLPFAWATIRRARRLGRLGQSLARGLGVALGFVGSLFGSFWAITEAWRSYFFDPRVMPALLAGSSVVLMAGCASPETYGEFRRKQLFESMLLAWLLGLALAWRWWSRSQSKPKPPGPSS